MSRKQFEVLAVLILSSLTLSFSFMGTDGGDESDVTYYFDTRGQLVYAHWSQQDPESRELWFCE